ncbi:asparagine synthase (glutamine-hydrolyzing) [Pedobacter yonginense]|uniref:asparagine synthase (glutamine-hydrolyzing) n=1 Tax=Pedobacter yonginense TaxID=651869 RepID=A0A317EMZ6_9SPHI|nr:asparagine synthase (glutamine-hydrolyzing) [Pedobacter yonginense]PWS28191.1 asparagine synthase (glutamine-hydrolyzing) [Pedobacter yonginense]
MCGIAGFLTRDRTQKDNAERELRNMGDAIKHRGPDDYGVWSDEDRGIGFSHRRLSILDLSIHGHQPMMSDSNRYVLIFNGEIYNHLELRTALERESIIQWKGHSDTETILKSVELIGIDETIKSLTGMFAIAIWDKEEELLYLVRDRMGEKPLFYGWQGNTFVFGSELKALRSHKSFKNEIDRNALASYFKYSYVPAPQSIYLGISKLVPGSILKVSIKNQTPEITKYWDLKEIIALSQLEREQANDPIKLIEDLDSLLTDSIKKQMLSDVPLGAFLSGGIDSSTIVGIMQSQSSRPVKTFTIGFDEERYNEAEHAKAIANHLSTEHTELYVRADDALNVIPLLHEIYDEPFADSSQIPTYLVTKLAKQNVTVSLSGDAGDELFSGYNRYIMANSTWSKLDKLPLSLRKTLAKSINFISPEAWNSIYKGVRNVVPKQYRMENFGDKIHKSSTVISSKNQEELYNRLITQWPDNDCIVIGGLAQNEYKLNQFDNDSNIENMMALDLLTYLPDDILVKVDRAAMSNSLETRVPFLDHRVIEFAWKVPLAYKLREGKGKWLLRQVLYKYVPKELIERPKMGFGVPIDAWLRGPLRAWSEDLLNENQMIKDGFLNPKPIRLKWQEHLSGKRNWQHHLWTVLMFQAWYRNQLKN